MFAESQLQDQHLFVRVFEHAPIGMIIGSLDGGFRKVNPSFCKMMGYSEEELLNLSFQEITHPDDLDFCVSTYQKLLLGEVQSYQVEKRYIHKSGKVLSGILSVSVVRDEYGKPSFYISQVVDITEQKAKEEELNKIKDLHQLISEHSQDMIIRLTSEGIVTYVSPAVRHQLGFEPEELHGKYGYDFWHPEDKDNWFKQADQDSRKIVYRVRHKNGHYVWQESLSKKIRNDLGVIQHVIGVCRDVTQRKHMETILTETEQRYKSLLKYTPVGVCALDRKGRFTDANPAYESLTGYSLEELTQMHYKELLFQEQIIGINNRFSTSLKGELTDGETYIRHKNGRKLEIRATSSPIIVNGELVGVYVIHVDLTEQKQTEELIRRSEKLTVVGELASGIAHEIRNPLTSLRGFVQLF